MKFSCFPIWALHFNISFLLLYFHLLAERIQVIIKRVYGLSMFLKGELRDDWKDEKGGAFFLILLIEIKIRKGCEKNCQTQYSLLCLISKKKWKG